jgi:hypothetical protein
MTLKIGNGFPRNVFELMGRNENSATYALGWALERSPAFAALLTERIAGRSLTSERVVSLQTHGTDKGFADVEIRCGNELHAILEAKVGFELPSEMQLSRYRPRLDGPATAAVKTLVSVSAVSDQVAKIRLPAVVDGVPVKHLSWGAIRGLAKKARLRAGGFEEKLWLRELVNHLEGYAAMNNAQSNLVYVVSLGSEEIRPGTGHTWIDVVEKDGSYFHPVGHYWPEQPPNYMGFRYRGRLQSVHRVESYEIMLNVADKNPHWCDTADEHFIYKLGPAMMPPRELKAATADDKVKQAMRVWCAIDTLLSGQFDLLHQARDETQRRQQLADASDL